MFNATNTPNQQPISQLPEQPKQGHTFVPQRKRFSLPKIPVVAQISGLLSFLLLGAGLLTANQLSQTSQDLSSQAANQGAKFDWESSTATMGFNQEKIFNVVLTVDPNIKASAAVVRVRTANHDLVEIQDIKPITAAFPIVLKDFFLEIDNAPTKVWATALGADPTKPLAGTHKIVTVKVKSKAKAGTAQVDITSNSEVAVLGKNTNANREDYKPLQITISETGATPTPSPTQSPTPSPTTGVCWNKVITEQGTNRLIWPNACKGDKPNPDMACAAVIVPLQESEITAYRAWQAAGSKVPEGCGTTPTPSASPILNVGFRIQGVNKAGVTVPAEITLRYKKKNSNEIIKKVYNITYTSSVPSIAEIGPPGTFMPVSTPVTDINFDEVDAIPNTNSTTPGVEIFVKTPTTLRKKLGIVRFGTMPPGYITAIFKGNDQVLMVGDFDRAAGQENKFRLSDITKMANQYLDVTNAITDKNKEFDVNYDGVFNFTDYTIVYNNYKQILLEGDTP